MQYRQLDSDGDYTFGRRKFLRDVEAVAQAILTPTPAGRRLRLLRGEWWENTADGLPLFEEILGRYGSRGAVDLVISNRIKGTKHVNKILFYQSGYNAEKREYYAKCGVDTDFGKITLKIDENAHRIEVIY